MKTSVKIVLLASCLVSFASNVNAGDWKHRVECDPEIARAGWPISENPDGSYSFEGRFKTISGVKYYCEGKLNNQNCKTADEWISFYENHKNDCMDVYEVDVAEQEAIDRYTMADFDFNNAVVEYEDTTPALGKVQNKINEVGSAVFGLIGL